MGDEPVKFLRPKMPTDCGGNYFLILEDEDIAEWRCKTCGAEKPSGCSHLPKNGADNV